ncbi:MAG TPA: asparagine synthase (glutamine-hydrolyzing) [Candidatus Binatia bacterium]
MCGIAGFVGSFVPGLANRMNAAQAHRGPDGQGVYEDADAGIALAHVRLAVLDPSAAAAQPMHSSDGRFVLIFNGEIYNFRELRQQLVARAHTFTSSGDTEVLLHGLQEYGISFIGQLNGMFAFALWDRRERELLLARDHMGIKPLYYGIPQPGTVLFSSEIKGLCAHPGLRREPDFEALQQHLAYCHSSGARTALKGVKRLPPGHWLRWCSTKRQIEIRNFWSLPFKQIETEDRHEAAAELQRLVRKATIRQLVSDVPVGAFLSGGLDSSFIATLAARETRQDFRCYTITYPSSDNRLDRADPDAPYARRLATTLGVKLEEIELSPAVADLWPKLIHHLDEPIADPAVISSYLICKLAKENQTTVLLSGQGADELFCGYPRYPLMHATNSLNHLPRFLRSFVSWSAHCLPGAREGHLGASVRRARRVLVELERTPEQRFLSYCANTPEHEVSRIVSPEFKEALRGHTFLDDCLQHMNVTGLDGLQRLQERDLSIYLPNHNLLYTDKTAMAVGLEARVPLLDVELVNRVVRYPHKWLLAGRKTKVLLRDAARGVVPDEIIDRPKAGFGAPYRKWLRYDLAEMWNELTTEAEVRARGWFDYSALQDIRARSQAGKDDLYMLQWAILTVELWARQFIDRNPALNEL